MKGLWHAGWQDWEWRHWHLRSSFARSNGTSFFFKCIPPGSFVKCSPLKVYRDPEGSRRKSSFAIIFQWLVNWQRHTLPVSKPWNLRVRRWLTRRSLGPWRLLFLLQICPSSWSVRRLGGWGCKEVTKIGMKWTNKTTGMDSGRRRN